MKITKIEPQKKGLRYNIHVDNNFLFSADSEDIIRYSITMENDLTEIELTTLINNCEYTKAYNYCLNLLNLRDYLSNEIRKKLINSQYSELTIHKVIDHLEELNLINDKNYIDSYLKEHLILNKESLTKIEYNLRKKGVDKSLLQNISIDHSIMQSNALELATKKLQSINNDNNAKTKIYKFLCYKGYDYEIIKKVITIMFNSDNIE